MNDRVTSMISRQGCTPTSTSWLNPRSRSRSSSPAGTNSSHTAMLTAAPAHRPTRTRPVSPCSVLLRDQRVQVDVTVEAVHVLHGVQPDLHVLRPDLRGVGG